MQACLSHSCLCLCLSCPFVHLFFKAVCQFTLTLTYLHSPPITSPLSLLFGHAVGCAVYFLSDVYLGLALYEEDNGLIRRVLVQYISFLMLLAKATYNK